MNRFLSFRSTLAGKMTFQTVTHVIFDMDGLLLDTEGIYVSMVNDIAKSYNRPYPYEVRMKIMGTTETMTAKIAVDEMQLPCTYEEFHRQHEELGRQRLANAPLLKGAERLIRHLHANKVPIALATSSSQNSVAIKTEQHKELFSLFHHKVMGSSDPEVKNGKPAPDIFLIAASRFPDKPSPDKCLVFEDAPNGVKAGRAAGMQVVMVPDVNTTEEKRQGATIVLNSLEDVQLELFGLPPFGATA